jgi:hypothetical protein
MRNQSFLANTGRRRLPIGVRCKTTIPKKEKQGRAGLYHQLAQCIEKTLEIWLLLATLITLRIQNRIDHERIRHEQSRQDMTTERPSLIPITVRKRSSQTAGTTEKATAMDRDRSAPQIELLTPSTSSQAVPIQIPQPGTVGAPWFTGTNVTDFLSEFDSICDDAHLSEAARAARVHRYCIPEIGRYLKGMPEWEDGQWDALKAVMRKEWEGTDDFQRTRTLAFLEALKNLDRDGVPVHEIRQYGRQFKQSASYLLKADQISEYQASMWFIQGLPRSMATRAVREGKLDFERPAQISIQSLYDNVAAYCDHAIKFQRMYEPNNKEAMEELVKRVPVRPVVMEQAPADTWRPTITQTNNAQNHTYSQAPTQSSTQQQNKKTTWDSDYEEMLLDKMSKLSIRNIRAEMARQQGQRFTSPGLGNRNYQQNHQQPANRQTNRETQITCFFCDGNGHYMNHCSYLLQMERDGKVHRNADGRLCVGPEEERGAELRFRRGMGSEKEQSEKQYREYVHYMMNRTQNNSAGVRVQSIKVSAIGSRQSNVDIENDTEEESSDGDYDHIGVAASRAATRSLSKGKDTSQGPVLDVARRVVKNKQEREAKLPAPKNARFGKYKPAVAARHGVQDEDVVMAFDEADIEEEIPEVLAATEASTVRKAAPTKDKTEKKDASGKRLFTALNQEKVTGARSLVKSMMDSKVEITIGNLLAGSGDARRLLFSAREWEANEAGPVNTAKRDVRVHATRMTIPERSFFAPCPVVEVTTAEGTRSALLDSGAEINVISLAQARKMHFVITRLKDASFGIVSYRGDIDNFVGVVLDAPIEIHGTRAHTHVFVAETVDEEYDMILGRPWQRAADFAMWQEEDGSCVCRITDDETDTEVEFHAAEARFRGEQHKRMLQSLGRSVGVKRVDALNDRAEET